jgi:hypothetical protein
MNVLALDVGTHSIKIIECQIEKKKIKVLHVDERVLPVQLSSVRAKMPMETSDDDSENGQESSANESKNPPKILPLSQWEEDVLNSQLKEVKEYLEGINPTVKIIFQAPVDFLSCRFFNLPVDKRKKAELMIPFQLEEDIPYSISDVHLSHSLYPEGKAFRAISSFLPKQRFAHYHQILEDNEILPNYLIHEPTVIGNYFADNSLIVHDHFCVLDIGHKSTKAYFFKNKKLTSFHICYVAGQAIDEMIIDVYKVKPEEAKNFKHENAFFLTLDQYHDVNPKQRDFAQRMDEVFSQFVNDFKRWDISFRVNHDVSIDHLFIYGGTSQIKNIENYLSQSLKKSVHFLPRALSADNINKPYSQFANAFFLARNLKNRSQLANLLTGDFAPQNNEDLPLFSLSYLGVRTALFSLLIIGLLSIEGWILGQTERKLNSAGINTLKSPQLDFKRRERNLFKNKPQLLIKKLKKKHRDLTKQAKAIEQFQGKNAALALIKLTQAVPTNKCSLGHFKYLGEQELSAKFNECNQSELSKVEQAIKSAGFQDFKSSIKSGTLELSFKMD